GLCQGHRRERGEQALPHGAQALGQVLLPVGDVIENRQRIQAAQGPASASNRGLGGQDRVSGRRPSGDGPSSRLAQTSPTLALRPDCVWSSVIGSTFDLFSCPSTFQRSSAARSATSIRSMTSSSSISAGSVSQRRNTRTSVEASAHRPPGSGTASRAPGSSLVTSTPSSHARRSSLLMPDPETRTTRRSPRGPLAAYRQISPRRTPLLPGQRCLGLVGYRGVLGH